MGHAGGGPGGVGRTGAHGPRGAHEIACRSRADLPLRVG
ncbi:hypothetical protein SCATT_43220 [Streptantibioticus cattleyicolor NRRL 8057 = DSM 46488]|uniref:Uncharacterized protein n=1 Tax=Streptantibioticus cattleyicolor (strain ATCC 35852 / DSM 46488 / JCM 4925 / NBRC 14057 / NRRL 8057) TaxID=1003195 RepID=G8WSY6_STREN|nr:hypothetical protein SCATT_43220 [Streptantibioticus cattleyicolor NRRL 8057 = DSM 46488]